MRPEHPTHDSKQRVAGWHFVAVGGMAIAAAALLALPTWSAMPGAGMSGQATEVDAGAKQAEMLAQQHGAWLRDAHGKAHLKAEAQPLPPQF